MSKNGVLLINLGTPDSPSPKDVRRYLDEFLMDPYVIDIAAPLRFLLVKGIILNTRPKKSAHAYSKIWTAEGSPLLQHSLKLAQAVAARMPDHTVKLAMRYGNPSIASVLKEFRDSGVLNIKVIPLYPQYSFAATTSSIVKVKQEARRMGTWFTFSFIEDFYNFAPFIAAFADKIRTSLEQAPWDHVLFSYHGVPERHVHHTDLTETHCLASPNCCDTITAANRYCYRAQSFATTRAIITELGLAPSQFGVSFQSRLGRTPWIKPYTDLVLPELAQKGVKDLVVVCPAFVADCLETLEEIEIRAQADFKAAGGNSLRLVPSLNESPNWADAVVKLAAEPAKDKPFVPEKSVR